MCSLLSHSVYCVTKRLMITSNYHLFTESVRAGTLYEVDTNECAKGLTVTLKKKQS